MWEPQPLETLRASTACTGITLLNLTYQDVGFYLEDLDADERIILK
jgi:hypothetical protein